ncbi:MAG: hypothetical protein ABR909_02540 [Candidatus Bathyarchaeia archaeon]|jgi:hypothetical protein
MTDEKSAFDVLESVKKHIETLKPLLPKQALVCIGEYPIKILLKKPYVNKTDQMLPILLGKSSDDIFKWIPEGFDPYLVLGFEDANIDTHFWYNVLPFVSQDETLIEGLKKKPIEKLHSAIMLASIWDGIGSASLPTLISKLKASNINSLSIAILPSKIQLADAYFNMLASLGMCASIDAATVVLLDRDLLENYEGVDRNGSLIKGNMVANYLVNLLLAKETLVQEISELSRTFNVKMYSVLLATGASIKIYGSLENMLNAMLLKPLLTFDLSSASLLYVLLRMPTSLKDKLPRGKIELAIAGWFKEKANLKSIYITEPIYVEDTSDRIDLILFVGGFDTAKMFTDLDKKVKNMKSRAVEKGFIKEEDWQTIMKNLEEQKEQ